MTTEINRRRFLGTATAVGVFSVVRSSVVGAGGRVGANGRINLAHIGMGTQGFNELGGLLEEPGIQIVAVCDPNRFSNDYVEWGKDSVRNRIREYLGNPTWREGERGCPGGREVGRHVVETYYANHGRSGGNKGCAVYADFRELLEKHKDLDAVKIMTPDHLHATIAMASMKRGLHVLMHKPIANRLVEGRMVLQAARDAGVATHLLAYGSGAGNGRIVERIQQGAIGALREIHNWTNRPVWPQYTEIPREQPAPPDGFDWDLWLGPERPRPYHPHYTHTVFRGWYDFGGGSMADMGIYSLWPVFTGLKLDAPLSAEAQAIHTCTVVDGVSRKVNNDFAYPAACTLRFKFGPGADRPGLELFWYDGGMRPRLPADLEALKAPMGAEGILFIGERGMILAGFHGEDPMLLTGGSMKPLWDKPGSGEGSPGGRVDPRERSNPWLQACRGGGASPGSFLNAAAITDTVNLGTVALRAGTKVEFDSGAVRITNVEDANRFLRRQYRPGWEL